MLDKIMNIPLDICGYSSVRNRGNTQQENSVFRPILQHDNFEVEIIFRNISLKTT